ncbi:MAG: DUF87 domain-containing protein [Patescibacteria group bacterium]|nr:DUF87 domain-containing protein [Patescibacteria group bacterium]
MAENEEKSSEQLTVNSEQPVASGQSVVDDLQLVDNATGKKPEPKPSIFGKFFGKKKEALKDDSKKPSEKSISQDERNAILETEKIYQEGITSIRDLIAPASFEVASDHLKVEGFYAQTYFVYAYPRYIDTNWLSPVVNFEVTMDISQFIYPINSAEIMKVLRRKVAQFQSSIRMSQEKGNVRDPGLETALQDAEELRTQLQRGQEKFFQFGMYFTVYAEDFNKLKKITKQLESLLGGKLVMTKRADLQMEYAFNSTLPLCMDELLVDQNMNTSPLSSTFPFISSELTSNDGILYGLNRHNEGLVVFDRFSLENANSVVFAKSGAGKSYAVKLEILRYLMMGSDVIVIDPENEYEALAHAVGGSYLDVSLNSERRINPFDLPKPLDGDEVKPGDLLRSAIIDLTGLMKLMMGAITASEEALLDKALLDVYATKGITMDTPDPSAFNPPTMEDFHAVLSSIEGAQQMATRVQKFTSGTFAGIFNKPTNVSLDNGLVVFSIRDLEDELRPIAMYIVLSYIWNRVRSEMKKRILVIDEAWSLMQHEDSAKFLYGLVKRARKYYLGVSTITQDVEDFMKSEYGKPIITNSSMQLLLKQSPSAVEMLQKVFNLTEGERYLLLNSGVGQGLFFAGIQHVAIQIIASYSEDKIITTDPEELLSAKSEMRNEKSEISEESQVPSPKLDDVAEDESKEEEVAPEPVSVSDDGFDNTDAFISNESQVSSTQQGEAVAEPQKEQVEVQQEVVSSEEIKVEPASQEGENPVA